jgi:hypothetical protein
MSTATQLARPVGSRRILGPETFELAARWYVFLFLNVYGIGKIAGGQFYRPGRIPAEVAATPLAQVGPFELAWTFMGHSFAYILFIGLAEVIGAWLLLWNRTKLLGVAILLPILVNIIVFDLIFLDAYGALASATIYTLLLGWIVVHNRDRVIEAFRALMPERGARLKFSERVRPAVVALTLMAMLFAVDQALVNWFGHGKG